MSNRIDPLTEERLQWFATEIEKLVYVKHAGDAVKLGALIRQELDRVYRRGYVAGLADQKGDTNV